MESYRNRFEHVVNIGIISVFAKVRKSGTGAGVQVKKPAGMRRGELETIWTRLSVAGVLSLYGPETASRSSKEIKVSPSLSLGALRSSSKMKVKQKAITLHPPQTKTQAGRTDR